MIWTNHNFVHVLCMDGIYPGWSSIKLDGVKIEKLHSKTMTDSISWKNFIHIVPCTFFQFYARKLFGTATRICKTVSVSYSVGNSDTQRVSFESSDSFVFYPFPFSYPLIFHHFNFDSCFSSHFQFSFAMLNLNRKINLSLMQSKS